ncbi:MAG: hypothetical protein RLY66_387 [Candidatus Parcubacteria bacterium]|jgi:hypothetical protein
MNHTKVWIDGTNLCWEGEVDMSDLAIIIPLSNSKLYQFVIAPLHFNGGTSSSPKIGLCDITPAYSIVIERLFGVYALKDASRLPLSLSFQMGVSPTMYRSTKLGESTSDQLISRQLVREDLPDERLCTVTFDPRKWVEQMNEQKAQEEVLHEHQVNEKPPGLFRSILSGISHVLNLSYTNRITISQTELVEIEKQTNGHVPASPTITEIETNGHASAEATTNQTKPETTDKPTQKEPIAMINYKVELTGGTLIVSELPSTVVDVSIQLFDGDTALSQEILAVSQRGVIITDGTLKVEDVFHRLDLEVGKVPNTVILLKITPKSSDASEEIKPVNHVVNGSEIIDILTPVAQAAPAVMFAPILVPTPAPTPTTPPAPEPLPEEKVLDTQQGRLNKLKNDLRNKKLMSQVLLVYLVEMANAIDSTLCTLRDKKFANNERAQKLLPEAVETAKAINYIRVEKWEKWPELSDILDELNTRIRNLGCTEGQPGAALKNELDQIAESVHKKNWSSVTPKILEQALNNARGLIKKLAAAEDEVIKRSGELEKELAEQRKKTEEQAAETARLTAELEEARNKPAQTPSPNSPPAPTVAAPAQAPAQTETATAGAPPAGAPPTTSTTPSSASNPLVIILAVVAALLAVMLIVSLIQDRKWTSDAVPPNGTVDSRPPLPMPTTNRLPDWANPRILGYYQALVAAGVLSGTNVSSSGSVSAMNNSSNYINGHSFVNGNGFQLNYMLPPTNQPTIIVTNVSITVTNVTAYEPQQKGCTTPPQAPACGDGTPRQSCIPSGAQLLSDGSWVFKRDLNPGEMHEYRGDQQMILSVVWANAPTPYFTVKHQRDDGSWESEDSNSDTDTTDSTHRLVLDRNAPHSAQITATWRPRHTVQRRA